jgi:hypothetical protein
MQPRQQAHTRARSRSVLAWLSGGVIGFTLSAALIGGAAFAQDDVSTSPVGYGQAFFENLAERLGITTDELDSAIDDAGGATLDEAVANGDITEEQADAMRERLEATEGFPGIGKGFGSGFGRHGGIGHHIFGHGVALDTVATTLGISEEELLSQLRDGATLEETITANDSTVAELVNALVAEAEDRLSAAVADGRITQEQADTILAAMPERLTDAIENGITFPGRWRHGPFWNDEVAPDSDTESDDATPEADETSTEA